MKKVTLLIIDLYKATLSPLLVTIFGTGCRFTPTCSVYTREAVEKFGTKEGLKLGLKRFAKCHPFSHGHIDPVPESLN
jgi:hypothetical protein